MSIMKQVAVDRKGLCGAIVPGEPPGLLKAPDGHGRQSRLIRDDRDDQVSQGGRLVRVKVGGGIATDLGKRCGVATQNRHAGGHGLKNLQPETFVARRMDHQVRGLVGRSQGVVAQVAGPRDIIGKPARAYQCLDLRVARVGRPHDPQVERERCPRARFCKRFHQR